MPRLGVTGLTMLLSVGGLSASPPQTSSAGNVLKSETLTLPSFADLAAGPRSPTEAESCCSADDMKVYERARTDRRFEMLRVTYRSDGLPVVAFIYRPSAAGDKRPVVVYNRGSYVRQNAARELLVPIHRLADAGFVVVAPMYRGSEGAPGRDEMGGADLADLMNIQPVIASLPYADACQHVSLWRVEGRDDGTPGAPRRLPRSRRRGRGGIYGPRPVRERGSASRSDGASRFFRTTPTNRAAIIERRSAVRWADRIGAPLLIMHGGDDTSVNPAHALQLAAALQRSGKTYELVIAAGARHVLDPFEAERDERAIRWFRRFMGE